MNAFHYIKIYFVILAAFSGMANAQSPGTTSSSPLIQRRAPDFSRWSISFVRSVTGLPNNRPSTTNTKHITVTKTWPVFEALFTEDDGSQSERWYYGNLEFLIDRSTKHRLIFPEGEAPQAEEAVRFSTRDFPGFEWIAEKNYTGNRTVNGRDCMVYISGTRSAASSQDISPLQSADSDVMISCIDAKTRLPVLLQKDGITRIYQFEIPPSAALVLPKDIQEWLNLKKEQTEKLARMPEKPF